MQVDIFHFTDGARSARGLSVIIDVFRAFSLACYVMDRGAERIIPVGDIERAYRLKDENPDFILMGERNEQIMPGFDYGNSPQQVLAADFTGKTIVHTTSAGTQGMVNAVSATGILTGSFVNAAAIVKYIRMQDPERVSLVCMGYNARYETEEDSLCASYIRNSLLGIQNDFEEMKQTIRSSSGKRFFLEEKQHFAPSADFELCLNLNAFDFVLRATGSGEDIVLEKINV